MATYETTRDAVRNRVTQETDIPVSHVAGMAEAEKPLGG